MNKAELVNLIVDVCEPRDIRYEHFVATCVRTEIKEWTEQQLWNWIYGNISGTKNG